MEFLFTVFVGNIHNGLNKDHFAMNEPAMQFKATPSEAERRFFESGYYLHSKNGLFDDEDERAFVSEFWMATPESSNEDDVPNRLRILLPDHPYVRVYPNAQFERLLVTRSPPFAARGGAKKRSTRRRRNRRQV